MAQATYDTTSRRSFLRGAAAAAEARVDATGNELRRLSERVAATPALTLRALQCKARLVQLHGLDEDIAYSIADDLLATTGA